MVFHGCFDFAYLLRELRREPLPRTAEEFYKSLKIYFPCIYDLKQVLKDEEELKQGGLSAISERIGVITHSRSAPAWVRSIKPAATVCSLSTATSD